MRMPPALAIALGAMLLAGCTTVHPTSAGTREGRAVINARAARQVATLTLRDGRSVEALALRVSADSLHWIDASTRGVRGASARDVETITFTERPSPLRNAFLGLLVGASVGYYVGHSNPEFPFSRGHTGAAGAFGLGVVGAGLGALTGSGPPNRDVYPVGSEED